MPAHGRYHPFVPLETYRKKRDFGKTPEPTPGQVGEGIGRFVVGRHRATRLHYDLRLEVNGVLASWAVPRGPTLDPTARRLAAKTEDHPIEYLEFEGVIPKGEYGGGDAIVWDWGTYESEETDDPAAALAAGELKFELFGEKLRGRFTLIRTGGRRDAYGRKSDGDSWLLLHKRDDHAVAGWDPEAHPASVRTGRTNEEVAKDLPPRFLASPPAPVGPKKLAGARAAAAPEFIPPMLATPVDATFNSPDWLFEVKWDGYRVETVVHNGHARIWTRNRKDAATYFPDLAGPAEWIRANDAVVDGEVVALDEHGRPSFSRLQERTGLRGLEIATGRRRPEGKPLSREERAAIPLVYWVFDLLYLDGQSLLNVPLEDRKTLLRTVLKPDPMVHFASHVEGDGEAFLEAAREQELEGIVAKRRDSIYEPGRRSRAWLKIKLRREQELVVIGWLEGEGTHKDIGSLVVSVNEDGHLRHAGQVGSGINTRTRRELLTSLRAIERTEPPINPAPRLPRVHWVEPRIVIRAEFAEWTRDGLVRQAAFKGVEIGKDASAVVREEAGPVRKVLGDGRRPAPTEAAGDGANSRAMPAAQGGKARAKRAPRNAAPPSRDEDLVAASPEELAALDAMDKGGEWQVGGETVRLTNLDKEIFPEDPKRKLAALTKRDLIRHYVRSAPVLVPYLRDRGVTVLRFPNGVGRPGFWQKDLPGHAPAWVQRWTYHHSQEGPKTYPVVDRAATLAWLAQEAAVELHPWTSPGDHPDQPSYALIDIDPGLETTWDEVLVLARLFRTALGHLNLLGQPKVTGKRGIQVWIPIRPGYTFDDTRNWVEGLSRTVGRLVPDLVSWEWTKSARRGRARLDFTQNASIKTLVAPYSVRAAAGAPVSCPITWEELDDPKLRPDRWTIRTLPKRLDEVGDLFAPALNRIQVLPDLD
jgi:bifunctional non-homologous end joining protein LigD